MNNHKAINLPNYAHLFKYLEKGDPIWLVAIYARLSKEDQKKGVSTSIEFQLKIMSKYIRDYNLDNFKIVEIYIDDGRTGTDFDRDDYKRLQHDISNKFTNCLIVKDLERYARNVMQGIAELDKLVLKENLRFISADDTLPIDTLYDPKAISSPKTYQALQNAETHAYNTSMKIRRTQSIKREDGEPTGGFPPYGFLKNPNYPYEKHYVIDPEAIKIIEQIFNWSYQGWGSTKISKKLNELGIPNPTKDKQLKGLKYSRPNLEENRGLWSPSTVGRILKNKIYNGMMVQGKTVRFDHKRHKAIPVPEEEQIVVGDCIPKVLDDEKFNRVQELIKQRTRKTKTGEAHLFSTLVYCSCCGNSLKKTNSGKNHYLTCRTKKDFGKQFCEYSSSINLKTLEDIILPIIQSQIYLIEDYQKLINDINMSNNSTNHFTKIKNRIEETEGKIKSINDKLDELYDDVRDGIVSKSQFVRMKEKDEEKISKLNQYIHELKALLLKAQQGINSNDSCFQAFIKYKNITQLDRAMLLELIKRIDVNFDKSINIQFNYKDQFELVKEFIEENKQVIEPEQKKRQRKI